MNENYVDVNVADQEKDENSVLKFYRKAIALRRELSCVKYGNYTEYGKLSPYLYTYSREDDQEKILVVCSYTQKEVPFKAPKGFDLDAAELILHNYPKTEKNMKPYEVRVYLWKK